MAKFAQVDQLSLTLGEAIPEPAVEEYRARLRQATDLMAARGLDVLVVYGDREHFGDIYHLAGVDPRFEEAILVLDSGGVGSVLLGNENLGVWPVADIGLASVLWQELSPPGQRRDQPITLESLLRRAGIEPGARVGINGQKKCSAGYFESAETQFTAPSYLVEAVRCVVGPSGSLVDAKGLFTDPEYGLRATSTARDIARFERGAMVASLSVLGAVSRLSEGVFADELSETLFCRDVPANVHPMVNFGPRNGLYSPRHNPARRGEVFQIAQGVRGGLTCRAGVLAAGPDDLAPDQASAFEALALNYFDVVSSWYEKVAVGVDSATVARELDGIRDSSVYEFMLNPGHQLHYEEWSYSTFWQDTSHILRSGEVIQCDVIPVVGRADITINIEDGVALADEGLRTELANDYPELWERVVARKEFLRERIGVEVHDSLLPLCASPLWHSPYAFNPTLNLTR